MPKFKLGCYIHLLLGAFPVLVDLLYDDFGVTVGEKTLDAEGGGDPETMDEGHILGCIVSGLKELLQDVF